jgi:hypothetical protein
MKETIHVVKMIDDLYFKFVNPVATTGQNSPF